MSISHDTGNVASRETMTASPATEALGTIAIWCGAALLGAAFLQQTLPLPSFWYTNRTLWTFLGFLLIPVGWAILRLPKPSSNYWRPTRPGMRFHEVILYTKPGCHLCDEAEEILSEYRSWLPDVQIVDIEEDEMLMDEFGKQIPVVRCDHKIRFKGRVNEILLRRLIEGTPPLE